MLLTILTDAASALLSFSLNHFLLPFSPQLLLMASIAHLLFLSFHLSRENEGVCSKGHLTIKEKPWAPGKASPGNSFTSPSYFNGDSAQAMESGRFCGQMMVSVYPCHRDNLNSCLHSITLCSSLRVSGALVVQETTCTE